MNKHSGAATCKEVADRGVAAKSETKSATPLPTAYRGTTFRLYTPLEIAETKAATTELERETLRLLHETRK